jgi:hypothetical protein
MEVFCEVLGLQRVCRSLLVYKVSVFPNSPVPRIFKCGVLVWGGSFSRQHWVGNHHHSELSSLMCSLSSDTWRLLYNTHTAVCGVEWGGYLMRLTEDDGKAPFTHHNSSHLSPVQWLAQAGRLWVFLPLEVLYKSPAATTMAWMKIKKRTFTFTS